MVAPPYPRRPRLEAALDLLFPPICVGCRRVGRWICARCWPAVDWLTFETCEMCGGPAAFTPCPRCVHPRGALETIVAVTAFEGTGREAVHALKYNGRHAISGLLGRLLAEAAAPLGAEVIVPVALHPSRKRERGYDQSALLARSVARELGVPLLPALRRVRRTQQQVGLDGAARRANVAGAFECMAEVEDCRVLLVDDVLTTGATMGAAAEAAGAAGAAGVVAAVFASAHSRPLPASGA